MHLQSRLLLTGLLFSCFVKLKLGRTWKEEQAGSLGAESFTTWKFWWLCFVYSVLEEAENVLVTQDDFIAALLFNLANI